MTLEHQPVTGGTRVSPLVIALLMVGHGPRIGRSVPSEAV
jgi:hypothetical protein